MPADGQQDRNMLHVLTRLTDGSMCVTFNMFVCWVSGTS